MIKAANENRQCKLPRCFYGLCEKIFIGIQFHLSWGLH